MMIDTLGVATREGETTTLWVVNQEEEKEEPHEDDDYEDTVSGSLYLEIPQDAKSGIYTLEVSASNDDATSKKTIQIVVDNDFDSTVFKSGNSLWIVNPTNNVLGYRIVPESPASVSESVVFVPAVDRLPHVPRRFGA